MSRSTQEIAQLLSQKFQRESNRLNSWGTKTNEKAALSFAMSVVEFVKVLMCESRTRELRRIKKIIDKAPPKKMYILLSKHVEERIHATSSMAKAMEHFAIKKEGERVWKPKVRKEKHTHYKHKHRSKHDR